MRILCGSTHHHEPLLTRPPVIVIGERKRKSRVQPDEVVRCGETLPRAIPGKSVISNTGTSATASDFPELRLRKVFLPKDLPPGEGLPVGTEEPRQLTYTAWGGALLHGGEQDDDGTEVNLAAQEPDRWRCHPLSATIAIAAEAKPVAVLVRQAIGTASRPPRIVGAV